MKRCLNCMEEYEDSRSDCPQCGWIEQEEGEYCINPGTILAGRYIVGMKKYQDDRSIRYIGWDALFSRKVFIAEYAPQALICRTEENLVSFLEDKKDLYEKGKKLYVDKGRRQILLDETRGVLETFAVFEENGSAYQVLAYPGTVSLRQVLEQEAPWSFGRTEALIIRLAEVLSAAHKEGLHHGKCMIDSCHQNGNGAFFLGCFQGPLLQPEDEAVAGAVLMDVQELAQIAGMALLGVETWQKQSLQKNLNALSKMIPKSALEVMKAVLDAEAECRPKTAAEFLERFSDDITIESSDDDVTVRIEEHEEETPAEKNKVGFWRRLFRGK